MTLVRVFDQTRFCLFWHGIPRKAASREHAYWSSHVYLSTLSVFDQNIVSINVAQEVSFSFFFSKHQTYEHGQCPKTFRFLSATVGSGRTRRLFPVALFSKFESVYFQFSRPLVRYVLFNYIFVANGENFFVFLARRWKSSRLFIVLNFYSCYKNKRVAPVLLITY